jgi:hypothetical protein
VYKSKTSNMLLEIRERGPFSNLARNTSRRPVKRCPQVIKDENDVDAQYSKNLVPPGRQSTVSDKIQGL